MTLQDLIQNMTPDIYSNLRQAVELRKWPNGVRLTEEQVELCMEAVIRFEIQHNLPAADRVGFMEDQCESDKEHTDIIKIMH
ncbi:hypothetical protein SAMN02745127_00448 [Oceanospirillum multiglobuliferum]|uniref:DUF1315 domain-containing protein n=1 Tax=Oceanospirillum multiglobuliferum TaxID=64969 RepID=A0A1T4LFD4_9GAMM|nr:DUF1315 family protein [Oceanospirillum multiglobuliferum]OPX56682.1 hypothetical protein BTE48_01935 [Oceanospirillum multiglobuliferum]SJZ53383.1 hypothetical protein SAMN02745127_00448 [Oceanospirillum multiglobuliferum]